MRNLIWFPFRGWAYELSLIWIIFPLLWSPVLGQVRIWGCILNALSSSSCLPRWSPCSMMLYLTYYILTRCHPSANPFWVLVHLTVLVAQRLKRLPAMQEIWVWSLGQEDPLEKEIATHSSILAWRIPWTEEPDGLQSTGSQRVGHDWVTSLFTFTNNNISSFTWSLWDLVSYVWSDILLLGNGTWKIWQNEEQWDKGRKRCWHDLLPVLNPLPYALLPSTSAEGEPLKPGHASTLCFLPNRLP